MRSVLFRVHKTRTPLALVLALVAALSLFTATSARADSSTIRIAIAYDIGGRGDNGVNDAVNAGITSAMSRFNLSPLQVRAITTVGTESDREARLTFLAKAGYDLIIAVGNGYESALKAVAPTYANIQFAIIGSAHVPLINVTNIDFAESEGAFVAGALAAKSSASGKVGFIADSSPASIQNLKAFTAGAANVSKKVVVMPMLLSAQTTSAETIRPIVAKLVGSKVDQLFSLWSLTGDVLTSVLATNTTKHPLQLIGLSPVQYFLHAPNASTVVAAAITEDYARATVDLISAAVRGNTLSDILDSATGVYGHRYSLRDGGIGYALYSRSAIAARAAIVSAESLIRSGKAKL
jgi:basic membrane protein A